MNVTCSNKGSCNIILNSRCAFYESTALPYIGINTNDSIEVALQKIEEKIKELQNVTWGTIQGNIEDQTDLIDYLSNLSPQWGNIAGDILQQTDLITYLNENYIPIEEAVFPADVTMVLSSGKTLGKYRNGETAPWAGLTAVQALQDAAIEYIPPVFTSFSVSGQATTVEIGTTLSGSKTFTWSITDNSGEVNDIDIFDITDNSTLIAGTPNDGTQSVSINTIQLNSNGATQQWRAIAHDSITGNNINSSTFTVTARYYRYFGPSAVEPVDSASVKSLPSSAFQTGTGNFTLNTGTTETNFYVALPPGYSISQVIDLDALNANITAQYVNLGTITVLDAGSTGRSYTLYGMTVGVPYSSNHRHQITIS